MSPGSHGPSPGRGLRGRVAPGLQWTFALLSLLLLGTVVAAVLQEWRADWRVWQRRFAQADGTPGIGADDEGGIRQIWLPELRRVDRCTTCHLGISHPEAADAPLPFRAHEGSWLDSHRPDRFGCTTCHAGQGEATSFRGAAHAAIASWSRPMVSRELMESRCGACHLEREPRRARWLARGRALITDRNCVACHELPGREPSEVRAPRLDGLSVKVRPAWLRGWLANPKAYLPRSRMGDFRLTREEVEALTAFLLEPHGDERLPETDWSGASPERGGELFRRSRCVTCHALNGRGGTLAPELAHVGAKVTREWLYAWIRDPHRLQPDTLMPRYRFTDAEVRDLAAYISHDLAEPFGLSDDVSPPDPALAAEGRRVFERRGCYSCHGLEGFPALARIGPSLAGVGDRVLEPAPLVARDIQADLPNWVFTKVSHPEQVLEGARMPTFGFAPDEAAAVTVALLSHRARPVDPAYTTRDPDRRAWEPQGRFGALVRRYRCLSCHQVQGTGGTLSTVPLDRIGSQLLRTYIEQYVQSPIAVRVGLAERMPHLNIAPGEARVLADYLSTVLVDDALAGEVPRDAETLERGRALFDRRGCVSCHIVGERGGFVGPDLNGSGARLQPGWVVAFLLDPERWKPGTLQPDYGLERDEAEALAAYTLSLPPRRGRAVE